MHLQCASLPVTKYQHTHPGITPSSRSPNCQSNNISHCFNKFKQQPYQEAFHQVFTNNHLLREGKKDLIYGINVSWSLSLHSSSFILTSTLLYPFGLHPSYSRGIFIREPSAHTVPSTGSAFPGCSLHKSCWSPLRTSWAASPISPASLFFSRPNELLLYTDIA